MNEFFESYFHIPYRERRGFVLLSVIALLLISATFILPAYLPKEQVNISISALNSLNNALPEEKLGIKNELHLRPFDPNVSDQATLESLGLPTRLAERVLHFRAKGGRFRCKEDFQKIYGMPAELYHQLQPYISLERKLTQGNDAFQKPKIWLDLNSADSAALETLPMIGAGRARLIIKYRNALGGFVKIEQVREVWGINDTVYQAIKPMIYVDQHFQPQRLAPDSIHASALFRHPYLRPYARPLVAYFKQHHAVPDSITFCKQFFVQDSMYNRLKIYLKQSE